MKGFWIVLGKFLAGLGEKFGRCLEAVFEVLEEVVDRFRGCEEKIHQRSSETRFMVPSYGQKKISSKKKVIP